MYAVIKTGGKQHKVQAGDVIEVEKLVGADETIAYRTRIYFVMLLLSAVILVSAGLIQRRAARRAA